MAGDMDDFKGLIGRIAAGERLSVAQAERAFDIILSGDATPSQMGGFLMGLRVRGEAVEEIVGGAKAMRSRMLAIRAPQGAVDVVGTGGDGIGTFNISTATALVVAACGVPVAKHGNRALSSKTGAADVLATLGVNIDADASRVQQALDEIGLCFMMAPRHHGAMRNVAGTRVELAVRTIFNLLGPMCNPANVKRQLIGVFAREWTRPMAETLRQLGSERVWVVHGGDGSDELTTAAPSYITELNNGALREFELRPEDAGLPSAAPEKLKGGTPEQNAQALRALLEGAKGAYRDVVLYNSAATLLIAERAESLREGVAMAAQALDEGAAARKLAALVALTQAEAQA